jgi:AcrR family transcriptional regulator
LVTTNTRELLIKTATNLFAQKGYANTSIREIGAKVNISSSIIYHYFKNKEELLYEITYSSSNNLIQSLHETEKRISDPVECLKEMLTEQTVIFSLKRKKEGKILAIDSYQLRGKRSVSIRKMQREIYDIYMGKIKEIEEKGLLKKVDLTVLTFSIFGIINSFHNWYKDSGRLSKEDVAKNMEKILFHGIIKQGTN